MSKRTVMNKWSETRKIGKGQYILRFGVLFWGVSTGLSFLYLQHFVFEKPINIVSVVLAMVLFPISGYFLGKFIWWMNEIQFRR
jgi:hypothetical protein